MLRKSPGGLLIAGLAAFAAYKLSKMSSTERTDLVNNLKEKGRKILGQFIPGSKAPAEGATVNGQ